MVAHTCNASYSVGRDYSQSWFEASTSTKSMRPPSQSIAECGGTCLSSLLHGSINRRIMLQQVQASSDTLHSPKEKRNEDMVQVAEHQLRKVKAQSSNPKKENKITERCPSTRLKGENEMQVKLQSLAQKNPCKHFLRMLLFMLMTM